MKKGILLILLAMISAAGFAQMRGFNVKGGMNVSNLTGDIDLNARVGFKVGAGFEYGFGGDTWSLQPSLYFTNKGAKKDIASINTYYLELPIMAAARVNIANNTNLVFNAGPYFACGVGGKLKIGDEKVNAFSSEGGMRRFDMGLGVGITAEFGQFLAGLEGQFGFINVAKNDASDDYLTNEKITSKNMNFSLVVGYRFWQ